MEQIQNTNSGIVLSRLLNEWSDLVGVYSSAILELEQPNSGQLVALYPKQLFDGKTPAWLSEFLKSFLRIKHTEKVSQLAFMLDDERYLAIIRGLVGESEERLYAVFCFELEVQDWQKRCVDAFVKELDFTGQRKYAGAANENNVEIIQAVETCAEVNRADKYNAAALKLVNAVAERWGSPRVAIGMLRDWGVKISAISGVGTFDNKMQIFRDYSEAMLEACDQNIEVAYPMQDNPSLVMRAAAALCNRHGVRSCLTLPLRLNNRVAGALLLESDSEAGFSHNEGEALRLMLELISPRLVELEERSRWCGGRLLLGVKRFAGRLVGAEHTWAKLLAVFVMALIVFFVFAKGDYRIDASFVLEPAAKRIIAAPYDSFLQDVFVQPSDYVRAGETLLGRLGTEELILQRASVFADQLKYAKEASLARSEEKTVEAQIAEAKARETAARLALFNLKLQQAELLAPVSGYISSREIDLQIGSPLKQGDILFEILPNDNLEVIIYVSEADIADIAIGQSGSIAVMGYPDRKVGITVFHISPVAQLVNERNSFKVKAVLVSRPEWMKPGMEGVAKIEAGQRNLFLIWTKSIVDWVRITFWI